jgi:hypothetical protein
MTTVLGQIKTAPAVIRRWPSNAIAALAFLRTSGTATRSSLALVQPVECPETGG